MQRPENAIVHLNLPGWILSTVSTSVLLVVLTLADSAMASTGGATRPAVSSVAGTGGATLNAESDRTGGAAGASAGGNYGKAGEIGCWSKSSSFGSGTSEFLSKTQWALLLLLLIVICRKGLKGIATALAGRFETAEGIEFQAKGVQIKLEGPVAAPGQVNVSLFASALDIEPAASTASGVALGWIEEHLTVEVSWRRASQWANDEREKNAREPLKKKRDEALKTLADLLKEEKPANDESFELQLVEHILRYATALERYRYVDEEQLKALLENEHVQAVVKSIRTKGNSPDGPRIHYLYHAVGITYALERRWTESEVALSWMIEPRVKYLPAARMLLCSRYHGFIRKLLAEGAQEEKPNPEEFASDFLQTCNHLKDETDRKLRQGANADDAFYAREFFSAAGTTLSMIAEILPSRREELLKSAEDFLRRCTEKMADGGPSADDFNNYADLLRQRERWDEGLAAMKLARQEIEKEGVEWPPDFAETNALIFAGGKRLLESLLAIDEYDKKQALGAWGRKDYSGFVKYLENQVIRAKLVFRFMRGGGEGEAGDGTASPTIPVSDIYTVIRILNCARDLLDHRKQSLPDKTRCHLLEQSLNDALGDAYLQTLWMVDEAQEAFDRSQRVGGQLQSKEWPEARWRRRVALASGRLRLAQLQRQNFNLGIATKQRKMAADLLATDPDMHRDLPLDAVGDRRLHSRILLYLDLLEASQDLASECFHQDGLENAQNLLDGPIEKLLATVGAVGADQTALSVLGAEFGKVVVPRWRFAERRKFYLQARLTAARSKQPLTEKIVADVEQKYVLARGGDGLWTQRVDLACGQFLLGAALAGEGNVESWYERALAKFEQVMASTDPTYRREAMHAYAAAVNQRPAVRRRRREQEKGGKPSASE